MVFSAALLAALSFLQAPDAAQQRALRAEESAVRFQAAMELAMGGEGAEAWLIEEFDSGDPLRHRALILAAAWMRTEASLELLDQAAAKGRRADADRAFALVLYGAYHPRAGENPKQDWARAATPFEQACLVAGLLGREGTWDPAAYRALLGRKPSAALTALLDHASLRQGLQSKLGTEIGMNPLQRSLHALGSLAPRAGPIPVERLGTLGAWTGRASWWHAARRVPSRRLEELDALVPVGDGAAMVFALYELSTAEVAAAFPALRSKVADGVAKSWLWGAVGDRGLPLPSPAEEEWGIHVSAGLSRLALVDLALARRQARAWAGFARETFQGRASSRDRWSAALCMALAAEAEDIGQLKEALEGASGSERQRLHPLWLLARRDGESLRGDLDLAMRAWSQELDAGRSGYLAREGPRWLAHLLVGETQAADFRLEVEAGLPGFDVLPLDHASESVIHLDLAELLLGEAYTWPELP